MSERPAGAAVRAIPMVGIVLAGGRSSRFGEADKLRVELRGRPLFHHPVLVLGALCDEVIVAIAADAPEDPPLPPDVSIPVRVVRDRVPNAGPLAGLTAGLEAADAEMVLVVGGDQPNLTPALLDLLTGSVRDADAAVLAEHGRPRPIPAALRRVPALEAAHARLVTDQQSLRALITDLGPVLVPERTWRRVDPTGAWRHDIDHPDDLPRS